MAIALIATLIVIAVFTLSALKYAPLPAIVVTSGAMNDPPQAIQWEPTIAPTLPTVLIFSLLICLFLFIVCHISRRLVLAMKEKMKIDSALGSVKFRSTFLTESIMNDTLSKNPRPELNHISWNRSKLVRYTKSHSMNNHKLKKAYGRDLMSNPMNQILSLITHPTELWARGSCLRYPGNSQS